MRQGYVRSLSPTGYHRMHYTEWGDPDNPRIVICVHGLTRTGRDFDALAQALQDTFRVVCPDIVGRGKSDWLQNKSSYGYPQYMSDLNVLIARVTRGDPPPLHWVGTSMGGLLGLLTAALPGNPIGKLVVNDVGMRVPKEALARLATYVGKDPRFPTLDALEAYVRRVFAPFGSLSDAAWRHLTLHGAVRHPDGTWGQSYDPAIGLALQGDLQDVDLSAQWDAIDRPTLLLRGAQSDVLPREVAEAMRERGPRARLVEIEGVGHAPMLLSEDQIDIVRDFLLE